MATKQGNTQWKDVDSTQLDTNKLTVGREDDIFDLVATLMPLLVKWREIGTALGLRHSVLEIIEASNCENARMCMQRMLVQYVRKSYNCDRFGDPSWMGVCKAVAHPAGGGSEETALAISKEHLAEVVKEPAKQLTPKGITKNLKQLTTGSQSKPAQDDDTYSVGCPVHLLQYDWFHGKLTSEESEKLLTAFGRPSFLVREEAAKAGSLVLSLKDKRSIHHFPINRGPGWYEVNAMTRKFDTVGDLVTYYKTNSLSDHSPLTLGSPCRRKMEAVADPVYSVVGRENPYQRGEPEDLLKHKWYCSTEMSVRQAEKKLSELEDSRFLIWVDRESELYLSLKLTDRMSHFKIERGPGWYTVQDTFQLFPSVPDLVGYYNLEQLPAASNVVNYYNLNGEFHSAVRGLQNIYDYITIKTTAVHTYEYISVGHGENEKHTYDYISLKDSQSHMLIDACERGDIQTARKLLLAGANPNCTDEEGRTPLYIASWNGHEEIVTLLIKLKADVNAQCEDGSSALHAACQESHTKIVEILLNANANVDLTYKDGYSALHAACQYGHTKIVEILLNANANIHLTNKTGTTALWFACFKGHDQVVEMLIKAGCNVDTQNITGVSALYGASRNGHTRVVKRLLKENASVNTIAAGNMTAVMAAAREGHLEVVKLLLSKGADMSQKDKTGKTAYDYARSNGHQEVCKLLLENSRSCVTDV